MCDIMTVVDELVDSSIDIVYVPNLVHFFSPIQVEKLLPNFKPKLKENAKVFFIWKGFSEFYSVAKDSLYAPLEPNTKMLRSQGLAWSRYVQKTDFIPIEKASLSLLYG